MPELKVKNLFKQFGNVVAVDHVSFEVKDGEFLTLLGPSGCGKSTTLFSIAGLQKPDAGIISCGETTFFDKASSTFLVPEKRNCGMVFQSYAVWPHMTVQENLAFPLDLRKVSKKTKEARIHETLELVELQEYKNRYPYQLSGGQQQRVALARALVYSPTVLLLDEPLSNLDAKLRERARSWLKNLQEKLGITTVYVTHDQMEALALSDRIAVMGEGQIYQIGSPYSIYADPSNPFVADFIGSSNFAIGHVKNPNDNGVVVVYLADADQLIKVKTGKTFSKDTRVTVSIRVENVNILDLSEKPTSGDHNIMDALIEERTYLGSHYQYRLKVNQMTLRAESKEGLSGKRVQIQWPSNACAIFEVGDD